MIGLSTTSQRRARAFFSALPPRFVGPVAVLAFLVLALIRFDLVTDVTYQRGIAVAVVPVTGKSLVDRMVIVRLGEWQRGLYTSDPYLHVEVGGPVCVSKRRMLLRRWQRYALVLQGYCRNRGPVTFSPLSHSAPSYQQGFGAESQAIGLHVQPIGHSGPKQP